MSHNVAFNLNWSFATKPVLSGLTSIVYHSGQSDGFLFDALVELQNALIDESSSKFGSSVIAQYHGWLPLPLCKNR